MNTPTPVPAGAARRVLVERQDLRHTTDVADPDAPDARPLEDGEARLAVVHFALTANNITYAAFGEAMKYWQFFPAADPAWGCIPVWGFAEVQASRIDGLTVGERLYGYFPMGRFLVVQPTRISAMGFTDGAAHRRELPAVYNQYVRCAQDPGYEAAREGLQAVLKPLFVTSFLIDDFLDEQGFFGATQLLLSSASSKTAFGTAFCLALRRGQPGMPRVLGLSSARNLGFARDLGCWDDVRDYDAVSTLDPAKPTVYIDFAGDAAVRLAVHTHFGQSLTYSCSVGGTHWDALGPGSGLPGPRPTLFFAPAQIARRAAAPPQGWGAAELNRRLALAWRGFVQRVDDPATPWLRVNHAHGAEAVRAAIREQLDGRADARVGQMLSL